MHWKISRGHGKSRMGLRKPPLLNFNKVLLINFNSILTRSSPIRAAHGDSADSNLVDLAMMHAAGCSWAGCRIDAGMCRSGLRCRWTCCAALEMGSAPVGPSSWCGPRWTARRQTGSERRRTDGMGHPLTRPRIARAGMHIRLMGHDWTVGWNHGASGGCHRAGGEAESASCRVLA